MFTAATVFSALELGFIYALVAMALFLSFRILNIADMSTDGTFTLGCAVSATAAVAGHPVLGLFLAIAAGAASGCVPAFAYLFMEGLADGAVMAGVPRQKAMTYVAQAVLGAASLVLESGQHPGALKDAVCSPGGSTIVGVSKLEEGGLRSACIQAVAGSAEKNKQLGK